MTTLCCTTHEQAVLAKPTNATGLQRTLKAILSTYGTLRNRLAIRHQQKIDRQAFESMLSLDDDLLQDIGVTRDAVRWAAALPLEENAAQALQNCSERHDYIR